MLSVSVKTHLPWFEATEILFPKNICKGYQIDYLFIYKQKSASLNIYK